MTAEAADSKAQRSDWDAKADLREAGHRLRKAQENYERFVSAIPHSGEEMLAAQRELQDAEAEFSKAYADRLRTDPEFQKRSEAIDERLGQGPPWEDSFSPRELLKKRGKSER